MSTVVFGVNETYGAVDGYETSELARTIASLTHHQVRDLTVELLHDRLVINGRSSSYYLKQLATQAARAAYPNVELMNEISVGAAR